jgi:hypothetical protein
VICVAVGLPLSVSAPFGADTEDGAPRINLRQAGREHLRDWYSRFMLVLVHIVKLWCGQSVSYGDPIHRQGLAALPSPRS